ncbi:MAG: hypothetical protein Fur009_0620 [Candidatus Microgenomates bacterium]
MFKKIFIFILGLLSFFLINKNVSALTFDLIPPDGNLERGQEINFTINVDTEGKSYSTAQIGMTYDAQYLQYVSVSAGNTFSTISAETAGDGKLIISGSNSSAYSGSDTFAYVTFKLIASSPGSTQLCVLFNPQNTPTPNPSLPPPTSLPKTGNITQVYKGALIGLFFLSLASAGLFFFKNI